MVISKLGGGGGGYHGGESCGDQKKMSQVFLRNLPLDMLESDIEEMLADCGPIKRIDLIKTVDHETGAKQSRGFGFVTFALEADASKAIETVNGKRVMGREISCSIALKKGSKRERSSGGDGREAKRPMETPNAASAVGEEAAMSSTHGASGVEKKSPAKKGRARVEVPADADGDAEGAGADTVFPASKKDSKRGGTAATPIEDKPSKASGKETTQSAVSEAGAETGAGLSKQEARKIARKAAKKELKQKAKDRGREEKAAQAIKRASSPEATTSARADRGDIGEEIADGESLDPKAVKLNENARTVLVFGVADDLTAKQLLKRIKKCASVSSLSLEENERGYFPAGRIARVVCAAKEGTRKVNAGIDGHTVHGQTLRVRRLMEIVPGDDIRQQKQQRLIVRNLNFLAKADDLVNAFSEFGPLSEVHIPTVRMTSTRRIKGTEEQEAVTRDRSRGFGFVQFLCPKDASRVVKDHGVLRICGREAAVDYSITKDKYNSLKPKLPQETDGGNSDNDNSPDEADDSAEESDGAESDDAMDVASDGSDDPEDEERSFEGESQEEDEEGGPDAAAGMGMGRAPEKVRRESDVRQGCTVFVRNVAFDCGEEEVKQRFAEFGVVRLALLVKDRSTGMPRGTAFVKFSNKDEADGCLAAAIGATDPALARDSGGSCIFMESRALHVTRAVDREEAGRLTVGAQKRKGHKDRRNLYLANEGLVLEDSAAAEGAARVDMEKRANARRDKKTKLKNPLFFVSPVRLSVRNLARHVTDVKLKALAVEAARVGIEAGRATPQDVRLYLEAQGEGFAAITPKRLQIPAVTSSSVVKAKVIRDMDKKPNPQDSSQLHPNKGYGFVEFVHHGQALAALRQMNNNPAFSGHARSDPASKGETSRLIVEFSVENHAKLKLQQTRKEAFEQRKQELRALGLGQDGRPIKEREKANKSRGRLQREKKKKLPAATGGSEASMLDGDAEQSLETRGKASEAKKRKRSGEATTKRDDRRQGAGHDAALGHEDVETNDILAGEEGPENKKRGRKKKKKASRYEFMDAQERAYQKMEKTYTAKTETAARATSQGGKRVAVKKGGERAGERQTEGAGDAAHQKKQGGRWFDSE